MKTTTKCIVITMIVLWTSFIGFCYQAEAQDEMFPQTPQEKLIGEIN